MDAIIFDYGNVIGVPNHMKACKALSNYSQFTPEELYKKIFLSSIEYDHELGQINSEEFWVKCKPFFNSDLSYEKFIEYWGDINELNNEIESILNKIKPSIKKYILSNTEDIHWKYISNLEVIKKYFKKEHLILSFLLGDRKPNKPFYLKALEIIGKPPHRIIYVDDIPQFVSIFAKMGVNGINYNCATDKIEDLRKRLSEYNVFD